MENELSGKNKYVNPKYLNMEGKKQKVKDKKYRKAKLFVICAFV